MGYIHNHTYDLFLIGNTIQSMDDNDGTQPCVYTISGFFSNWVVVNAQQVEIKVTDIK